MSVLRSIYDAFLGVLVKDDGKANELFFDICCEMIKGTISFEHGQGAIDRLSNECS